MRQDGKQARCNQGQTVDPPNKNVELLDTPGILWPKFEDEAVGMRLAYIGSIKDDILNMEELSLTLIDFLREKYSGVLEKRYQIRRKAQLCRY